LKSTLNKISKELLLVFILLILYGGSYGQDLEIMQVNDYLNPRFLNPKLYELDSNDRVSIYSLFIDPGVSFDHHYRSVKTNTDYTFFANSE